MISVSNKVCIPPEEEVVASEAAGINITNVELFFFVKMSRATRALSVCFLFCTSQSSRLDYRATENDKEE